MIDILAQTNPGTQDDGTNLILFFLVFGIVYVLFKSRIKR